MKLLTKSLFTFLLATSIFLSTKEIVAQDADPVDANAEEDPCLETEEKTCLEKNEACTADEEGCCGNLACVGFTFFKKCVDPPACHEMWHDCSDGIQCCDTMKCIDMGNGKLECGVPTIGSRTVDIGDYEVEVPPTSPPKNTKTTKRENPVVMNIAASSGDPHSEYY